MSKANAKQQTPAAEAAQEPAAQHKAAPATAAAAADQPRAVVPAAPPKPGKPDEHAGQGGLYVRKGGVRKLVERTDRKLKPETETTPAQAKE